MRAVPPSIASPQPSAVPAGSRHQAQLLPPGSCATVPPTPLFCTPNKPQTTKTLAKCPTCAPTLPCRSYLNNDPFSAEFRAATSAASAAPSFYGRVPPQHWSYPPHIDRGRAAAAREAAAGRMPYGGSESYRHMCRWVLSLLFCVCVYLLHSVEAALGFCCGRACNLLGTGTGQLHVAAAAALLSKRFPCSPARLPPPPHPAGYCSWFSGFFFDHPLLAGFECYWRVEPHVHFMCDIRTDPFRAMRDANQSLAWTIVVRVCTTCLCLFTCVSLLVWFVAYAACMLGGYVHVCAPPQSRPGLPHTCLPACSAHHALLMPALLGSDCALLSALPCPCLPLLWATDGGGAAHDPHPVARGAALAGCQPAARGAGQPAAGVHRRRRIRGG